MKKVQEKVAVRKLAEEQSPKDENGGPGKMMRWGCPGTPGLIVMPAQNATPKNITVFTLITAEPFRDTKSAKLNAPGPSGFPYRVMI